MQEFNKSESWKQLWRLRILYQEIKQQYFVLVSYDFIPEGKNRILRDTGGCPHALELGYGQRLDHKTVNQVCSFCLYQHLIAMFLQLNTGGERRILLMWGNVYAEQWNTLLGIWRKAVSLKDLPQTHDSTLGWNRKEVIRIFLHTF